MAPYLQTLLHQNTKNFIQSCACSRFEYQTQSPCRTEIAKHTYILIYFPPKKKKKTKLHQIRPAFTPVSQMHLKKKKKSVIFFALNLASLSVLNTYKQGLIINVFLALQAQGLCSAELWFMQMPRVGLRQNDRKILSIENSWTFNGLQKITLQDSLENPLCSTVFLVYKEPQENFKGSTQDQQMTDEYLPLQESNRVSLFSSCS